MADRSSIEWTDATWNPTRGCSKIAQGCKHCYAETFAERFRGVPGHAYERGFDPRTAPDQLTLPLRWKKPRRIFVDSMSDLFHEAFPFEYIAAVFGIMAACPQHTFQVLTKRSEHAVKFYQWLEERVGLTPRYFCNMLACEAAGYSIGSPATAWPLPNVWIGSSIAEQADAEINVPFLLQIPAAVRFLSIEPLISDVNLARVMVPAPEREPYHLEPVLGEIELIDCLRGEVIQGRVGFDCPAVDWVIVGGESGHGARPCNVKWIRSVVEQCRRAAVPVFVKQLGRVIHVSHAEDLCEWGASDGLRFDDESNADHVVVRLPDPKGGDWSEWPEDLRVREFPLSKPPVPSEVAHA